MLQFRGFFRAAGYLIVLLGVAYLGAGIRHWEGGGAAGRAYAVIGVLAVGVGAAVVRWARGPGRG